MNSMYIGCIMYADDIILLSATHVQVDGFCCTRSQTYFQL